MLAQIGIVDQLPLVQMKRAVGTRAYAVAGANAAFFKVDHFGFVPIGSRGCGTTSSAGDSP